MFAAEYPDGFGELYDLETDPWEMKNLYFEPDFQEVVRELERELIRWLVTTTRPATVHQVKPWESDQAITGYGKSVNADGRINPQKVKPIAGSNYV